MCSTPAASVNVPMRKAGKGIGRSVTPPKRAAKVAVWAINPMGPPVQVTGNGVTYARVSPADQIAANERRMREISAQLVRNAQDDARKAQAARAPVSTTQRSNASPGPAVEVSVAVSRAKEVRAATVTPIRADDWHAAARFTLSVLRKPVQLVDSTCKRVEQDVTQIHRGVIPGDWAGLAAEVDTGRMTHDQAVALAGTWKRSVGVAS